MSDISEIPKPTTIEGYEQLWRLLESYRARSYSLWKDAMRYLCRCDLFFLVTHVGTTREAYKQKGLFRHPFYIRVSREIEKFPERPDVWRRGGGKSTFKTRFDNIRYALIDPNSASIIHSYQKDASQAHLLGIDQELSQNKLLFELFDDILWDNPRVECKKLGLPWSATSSAALTLKRTTTRPEFTFEAGYLRRPRTGKHYNREYSDDIEDDEAVSSLENLKKLHRAYQQVGNLKDRTSPFHRSFTGTLYHSRGVVARQIIKHGENARVYPGEVNLNSGGPGPLGGYPGEGATLDELWEAWDELDGEKDAEIYAMQVACTYKFTKNMEMRLEWFRKYFQDPLEAGSRCLIYPCVDPSKGQTEDADPASIFVWGTTVDKKYLMLDLDHRRLPPHDLYEAVYRMVSKWMHVGIDVPHIRVEEYGQSNWCGPIEDYLNRRGIYVPVVPVADYKTKGKLRRIHNRWHSPLKGGSVLTPSAPIMNLDEDGNLYDVKDYFFMCEVAEWPKPMTDNIWDAGSLIFDKSKKVSEFPVEFPLLGDKPAHRESDDPQDNNYSDGTTYAAV